MAAPDNSDSGGKKSGGSDEEESPAPASPPHIVNIHKEQMTSSATADDPAANNNNSNNHSSPPHDITPTREDDDDRLSTLVKEALQLQDTVAEENNNNYCNQNSTENNDNHDNNDEEEEDAMTQPSTDANSSKVDIDVTAPATATSSSNNIETTQTMSMAAKIAADTAAANSQPLSSTTTTPTANNSNSDSNSTQPPPQQQQQEKKTMDITITVLSLHGILARSSTSKKNNKNKKKGGTANNNSMMMMGGSGGSAEETATMVASFSQTIGDSERIFMTHVPSLPTSLDDGSSNNVTLNNSNGNNNVADKGGGGGGGGGKQSNNTKGKGGNKKLLQPVVHWPGTSEDSSSDDDSDAGNKIALSTLNFTRDFIHEDMARSGNNAGGIQSSNAGVRDSGVGVGQNISSNSSVSAASINSKTSKQSKSSTTISSKASSNKQKQSKQHSKSSKQRFIPQTCPINLSVSRSGKMILIGKVNLIINGEENGEQSLTIPITSSIKNKKSMILGNKVSEGMVKGVKSPMKGMKMGMSKLVTSGGGSSKKDKDKDSEGAEQSKTPMVKIKGDSYSFGLESNAMLRVLVNVTDPNEINKHDVAELAVDEDEQIEEDVVPNANEEQQSMEGLSVAYDTDDDSSLECDDYQDYIPISNELRTLRTQLVQAEEENKILHMELRQEKDVVEYEQDLVRALHIENGELRNELRTQLEGMERRADEENGMERERLEDENMKLKAEVEQLKLSLDAIKFQSSSSSPMDASSTSSATVAATSSPSFVSSSSTTADTLAATLRIENTKLRTELTRAQSNATTLLAELNTSKSESEMLPFYETRVTELLEELKKRDLEVRLLKEEVEEMNVRAKATLVEGLLWDDEDNNNEDKAGDDENGEDGIIEGEEETRTARLSFAARKLAAAGRKAIEDVKVADRELFTQVINIEGGSDGVGEHDGPLIDEEGKKLLAEIDKIYSDKDAAALNGSGDNVAMVKKETAVFTNEDEEEDGDVKFTPIGSDNGDSDNVSVADTEATTPEREASEAAPPLMREWGANNSTSSANSDEQAQVDTDDDTKNQQAAGRGLGLRGLGSRLKTMEEKMRERQQVFREQQQKILEEQERQAEIERLNAIPPEPGLKDVLISRIASRQSSVEAAKSDAATSGDDAEDAEVDQNEDDDATTDDATANEGAAPNTDIDLAQTNDTLKEIEQLSNEASRRESKQGLLLDTVDSLERDILSSISRDELAENNDTPTSTGKTDNILAALSASDASVQSSTKDEESKDTDPKEKKSKKGIMSRIKRVGGRKNKKSKDSAADEEEKTEEDLSVSVNSEGDGDESCPASGGKPDEQLNTTQDLSDDSEEDEAGYDEFIKIISTDELDRKESNSAGTEGHIGTVVVNDDDEEEALWSCDICKDEQFDTYEAACEHEKDCKGGGEAGTAKAAESSAMGDQAKDTLVALASILGG